MDFAHCCDYSFVFSVDAKVKMWNNIALAPTVLTSLLIEVILETVEQFMSCSRKRIEDMVLHDTYIAFYFSLCKQKGLVLFQTVSI